MKTTKMKLGILLISFAAYGFNAIANDTLTFTWKGSTSSKYFQINATENEKFIVNWGDFSIDTLTGTGGYRSLSHAYADTNDYEVRITGTANCFLTAFVAIYSQITALNLHKNTNMQYVSCHENQLAVLDASGCTALKFLQCDNNQITSLNVHVCAELLELWCSNNRITTLDVSTNTALKNLYCADNKIGSLNLNSNTVLFELDCGNNQLTTLNVNANPKLDYIDCSNNKLKNINLYSNTALEYLYCNDNLLTDLDLSANILLEELDCFNNQLTDLNLQANTALWKSLNCSNNLLSSLDLSANTLLRWLDCSKNQLTNLDLNKNTALERLWCSNNQLTALILNANTLLWNLECSNNLLTDLNLQANTLLRNVECTDNQLNHLDLSANMILSYLKCFNNRLQLSDLYNASEMINSPLTKYLGTQTHVPQVIMIGDTVDFSAQKEFGDTATLFTILGGNGNPARPIDYTLTDGIIVFHYADHYQIIMTNSAIVSHQDNPAQVIAEFIVTTIGTTLSDLSVSEGTLTPAFSSMVLHYTVNVDYSVSSIIITAAPTDPNAIINGDTGYQQLSVGKNVFTITVTASDGTTYLNYTVTVNRATDVGIAETHNYASLRVFPNPTNSQLTIKNEELTIETIEIYDIVGQCVFTTPSFGHPSKGGESSTSAQFPSFGGAGVVIDVSHLANGMYFLKVDNRVVRFVKE